jgi:esterase/lipase superfamily enzyme
MAVKRRGDRRKGIGRQSGRRKGDIEKIKFEGERDKEQQVTVRHEAVPPKKASSVWSWHEEFIAEWSESFISKKTKKIQKDEKK